MRILELVHNCIQNMRIYVYLREYARAEKAPAGWRPAGAA